MRVDFKNNSYSPIKDVSYDVKFYKTVVDRTMGRKTLNYTCTISLIDDDQSGADKYIIRGTGMAEQSIKDKPSKIFGKKLAFTRALYVFDSKKERTIFWNEYKKNFKI